MFLIIRTSGESQEVLILILLYGILFSKPLYAESFQMTLKFSGLFLVVLFCLFAIVYLTFKYRVPLSLLLLLTYFLDFDVKDKHCKAIESTKVHWEIIMVEGVIRKMAQGKWS